MSSLDGSSSEVAIILDLQTVLGVSDFIEVSDTSNIVVIAALSFVVGDAAFRSIGIELSALRLECLNSVCTIEGPVDLFECGTTSLDND